jgi:hypothetical protein
MACFMQKYALNFQLSLTANTTISEEEF